MSKVPLDLIWGILFKPLTNLVKIPPNKQIRDEAGFHDFKESSINLKPI